MPRSAGKPVLSGSVVTVTREAELAIHPGIIADLQTGTQDHARILEQAKEMTQQTNPSTADAIIIGAGPGGYVSAIRTAQLGGKVIVIEKDELGGVCLNRGCIPTKVMLSSADIYDVVARRANEFGVNVGEVSLDYARVIERRDKVVKQLVSGVGFLMKKHGIQVLKGTARFVSRNSVEVALADGGKQTITARNIVIATGSEAVHIPIPGLEGDNVWDSDKALAANECPGSLLIIGGGYIGVEWGYMFRKFGADVTIVELMPQILPQTDSEIASELRKLLERGGIKILTDSRVTGVAHRDGREVVTITTGEKQQEVVVDKILVAVGRRPSAEGLGVEDIGIKTDRGKIVVNERMQTNIAGIYAIGDVVGGALLAHKASEEGVIAAENIMGHDSRMSYRTVPAAIYTTPEVATVGMSEEQAKEQGIDYRVGKFYFRPNGKALGLAEPHGFVKILAEPKYGEILGCHIIGAHATDLIHEIALAMNAEATIETIARTIHAHPTLAEVIHEAALDVSGESIHKG